MAALVQRALPVGTPVRYYPVDGEPDYVVTRIRSTPWALGHGEIVILVDERAGGVAVNHLEVI